MNRRPLLVAAAIAGSIALVVGATWAAGVRNDAATAGEQTVATDASAAPAPSPAPSETEPAASPEPAVTPTPEPEPPEPEPEPESEPSATPDPAAPGPTYIDGVLVVNKTYALPPDFDPGLQPEVVDAFARMQGEASAAGIALRTISGYRPFWSQERIYGGYVQRLGVEAADRTSARPGHSEHQSGLAIDVNSLDPAWGASVEGRWVAENAPRFGFVVRYPDGKEEITGYAYEPWHLRYLGPELATSLTEAGLTLEEHFGIDSAYR